MTPLQPGFPTRRLRRTTGNPLWQQLLADLRTRLADGEFTAAFPGELELVEQYAVSRHTVREALRQLRSEGVVTAARGRRPRLAPAEVEQPLGALASLFAAVESRGLEQRSRVRALDVRADGVVAVRLGLEESTPLVYLERLRLAGDEPLALDRSWLPADVAQPLLDADFTHTALYDELAEHCGIRLTGGRERVRAVQPTRGERGLLQMPATAALLMVERTGCLHGRPLEFRHTLVRGDRYAVTASFDSRGYSVTAGPPPNTLVRSHPMTTPVPDIDPVQAARLADAGQVLLLDVREHGEWDSGHAPQATHTPLGDLDPAAVPQDRPVVAVCRSGNRSGQAAQALSAAGVDVRNLAGGMSAWASAGLPVVRTDGAPGAIG